MPKESGKMNQRQREICARLKQFREQIKWSQAAFAHEIGITKDQIASIEYQRTPLKYNVGDRACLIFDVNPEWLATGNGQMSPNRMPNSPAGNIGAESLFSEIYDIYSQKLGGVKNDKIKPKSKTQLRRESPSGSVILDDPTGFFIDRLLEVLRGEKFEKPVTREQFVFDVVKMAKGLALDYRLRRLRCQVRLGANFKLSENDLSQAREAKVKELMELKMTIRDLRQTIKDLEAKAVMMEEEFGSPVSGSHIDTQKPPSV